MNACILIDAAKIPGTAFGGTAAKAVYMALADHASAKNKYSAWPSRETLAKLAGCSRATVTRALSTLANAGWIRRETRFRQGMHTTSRTHLAIDKLKAALASIGRGLTMSRKGAQHEPQNVKENAKKHFRSRENEKIRSTRAVSLKEQALCTCWSTHNNDDPDCKYHYPDQKMIDLN